MKGGQVPPFLYTEEMTIREMHIEITLSAQQVASAVNRKLRPEEIDWFINKTIERFVRKAVKPKEIQGENNFQEFQIDADKIDTLIEDVKLKAYKDSTSDNVCFVNVEPDHRHYIESSSRVVKSCDEEYSRNYVPAIQYIKTFEVKKSVKTSKPYYNSVSLSVGNKTLLTGAEMPQNLQSVEFKFELVNKLMEVFRENNIKAYWETTPDGFKSNTFALYSNTNLNITFIVDGEIIEMKSSTRTVIQNNSIKGKYVANYSVKDKARRKLQQSSFSKSSALRPLVTEKSNKLTIYHDDSFIVTDIDLTYVRRPRKVSLSLGYNCDLPESFHDVICDLTVEYIKQTIQDPNYQWKVQDNKLRAE